VYFIVSVVQATIASSIIRGETTSQVELDKKPPKGSLA